MKQILFAALSLLCAAPLFSQNAADALRFSLLNPSGTARFVGTGGAFGAVGADFSTLSQNPAGLALFRRDEFMFTPGVKFSNTQSSLNGGPEVKETSSKFQFDNLGIVFNTNPIAGKWKTFNVGIGMNKMANFSQSIYYEGQSANTIIEPFFRDVQANDQANNGTVVAEQLDAFSSRLAYDAGAVYYQDNQLTYDFVQNPGALLNRSQSINTKGHLDEMVLSFAGNYDEKLMLGMTIGVPFVNYKLESDYRETDPGGAVEGNVPYFSDLSFTESVHTQGIGINAKFGVIFRPIQMLRLGAAVHTPTWMGLTDNFDNSLSYNYTDGTGTVNGFAQPESEGNFDYRLRTPWRASLSAAAIIRKSGFLSAEVEVVDYSSAEYNLTANVASTDNQQYERTVNEDIRRKYGQAVNVRLGGELALDQFRLRAGVNLNGSPYEDSEAVGAKDFTTAYTGGFGVHGNSFYVDLGARFRTGESTLQPPYVSGNTVTTSTGKTEVVMTVGLKF